MLKKSVCVSGNQSKSMLFFKSMQVYLYSFYVDVLGTNRDKISCDRPFKLPVARKMSRGTGEYSCTAPWWSSARQRGSSLRGAHSLSIHGKKFRYFLKKQYSDKLFPLPPKSHSFKTLSSDTFEFWFCIRNVEKNLLPANRDRHMAL